MMPPDAVAQPDAVVLPAPPRPVRFVTAASLFDGHDASINIIRRILVAQGAEVVHLGHNRSVDEVVTAAVQEDVQGVAVSSYQGGHVEYFSYLVDLLHERGAGEVRVFGGGGGVIVAEEIEVLRRRGVRIFSPEDGQHLGLPGMVATMIAQCAADPVDRPAPDLDAVYAGDQGALARLITLIEASRAPADLRDAVRAAAARRPVPVLGVTGTGGSGKSSLTDELIRRACAESQEKLRIAVLAVDPIRRRGGGALLGDRIRMNSLAGSHTYFRSMAARPAGPATQELPEPLGDVIAACRAAGYDLVIVETPGIGQGDAGIVPYADVALYVMTPEYGASSQLEKIDMLDFADAVAINKYERRGAEDARRDVARQLVRNRDEFGTPYERMPVFGTSAATFDDDGVTALYRYLRDLLAEHGLPVSGHAASAATSGAGAAGTIGTAGTVSTARTHASTVGTRVSTRIQRVVPAARVRYLAEIAEAVRGYRRRTEEQAGHARRRQQLAAVRDLLAARGQPSADLDDLSGEAAAALDERSRDLLAGWPATVREYAADQLVTRVRDRELRTPLWSESLSGTRIPRVALPRLGDDGDLLRYLCLENLPGRFPYTAGVFPLKRDSEDPVRMFAGEGDPFRTNRRFHLLAAGAKATRLSTAFDSVTLYGRDPDPRPDIYGKIGTSGVSIATVEDMMALYDGFDLCAPDTSVSMTINGPAPAMLAFFFNTAINQRLAVFAAAHGRPPTADEAARLRAAVLRTVRGTVQADILKEDQGQNTCLFSTEFSLRMMADIQEWFIRNEVRNFYSVSISGYHIAEAGANPISQLAFTLANGFTYVEAYLARGMAIDDFAPNLSFFFSSGMDAEYAVLGRVARRIWAVAMRERYGAGERAQKLKYHVQTSGRSLHAQEMNFNDIRTTLQALTAIYENANSLHTNAYDEAVTTPSEESVRRAMAIQLVINEEWGLARNENPLQGSYIVDELTDLVEEAVLVEFDRLTERGGVLGAMETGYQRGRIQDESMRYEQRKHDGSLPIIGVNTFRNPYPDEQRGPLALARGTEEEKRSQLLRLRDFHGRHRDESGPALARLRAAASNGENVFEVLMDAARVCSLGQITEAFFEVGGAYRRNI